MHVLFWLAAHSSLSKASSTHYRTTTHGVGGHRYSHHCLWGPKDFQTLEKHHRIRRAIIETENEIIGHSSVEAPENMCVKQENQTIKNTLNPLMQCPREPTYSLQLSPTNNSPLAGKEVTVSHSSRWPSKPVSLSPEMCILCHCPSISFSYKNKTGQASDFRLNLHFRQQTPLLR